MRRTPRCRQARRQLLEKRYDLPALQLPANNHLADTINTVHLKDRLSDIKTDCCDRLHAGSSESWEPQQAPRRWHSRAGEGAVHSIKSGHMQCSKFALFNTLSVRTRRE